jgi:hypothetical protein
MLYLYKIQEYWTVGIIGPPTPPVSLFLIGSTVDLYFLFSGWMGKGTLNVTQNMVDL